MIDFGSLGAVSGLPLAPQGHDGKIDFGERTGPSATTSAWRGMPRARRESGATYRSQIDHTLAGTADFTVPAEVADSHRRASLFTDTASSTVLPMPPNCRSALRTNLGRNGCSSAT